MLKKAQSSKDLRSAGTRLQQSAFTCLFSLKQIDAMFLNENVSRKAVFGLVSIHFLPSEINLLIAQ